MDKNNDGPEGQALAFSLQTVELYRDAQTGETTTAPVVIPTEVVPQQGSRKKNQLSPKHERARRALVALASGSNGKSAPEDWGLPAGIKRSCRRMAGPARA